MSKPSSPTLLPGNRSLAAPAGGGLRGSALSPLPPKGKRSGRWLLWLILIPLLLLGLTYLLGRTVEPIRARVADMPVAGKLLFADPVWPILWNKPATPAKPADTAKQATTAPAGQGAATATSGQATDPSQTAAKLLLDQAQARLAAAEAKETELKKREADLKAQETQLKDQTVKLAQLTADTEALRTQLQGQLRTEQDRVEIVRAMRAGSQAQFFSALTDDEAVAILKYMTAEEISRILAGMDSFRAARIFYRLPTMAQPATTP